MKRCGTVLSPVEDYDGDVIVNCKRKMRLQTPETIEDKVETDSTYKF